MDRRQWPNLFVVGAPKAGTTSLWRYLDQHPDIYMSPVKEPGFLAGADSQAAIRDEEAYLDLFAAARGEKLRGEASPSYLARQQAARTIRRTIRDPRIVISLREPVDRTHSSYLSLVSDAVEDRTFLEAVSDDLARRRLPGRPNYVKPSLYAVSVQRWLRKFGDDVFVLFFEELAKDPARVVRALYEFLDVDPSPADSLVAKPHNQFRAPRNRAVERLVRARRLGRAVIPRRARDRVFEAAMKPAKKPKPDPESIELLRNVFGPDVAALRELLGRDLPRAWERRFPAGADEPAQRLRRVPDRGPAP